MAMYILEKKEEVAECLQQYRNSNKKIGFIPTMGALHEGHLSLVKRSVEECDVTIVSVFVNPTQFNDKNDLLNYPRCVEKDCELLRKAGCNAVFTPSVEEIYPEPDTRVFSFDGLDKVMEGEHRPGHFNGVAQVVSKLFDIVKPDKAYFGLKDFQQVAIIKNMVRQLNLKVEIVPCPIVREADGLAKSSRNMLLEPEYRAAAPAIHKALYEATTMKKNMQPAQLCDWITKTIDATGLLKTEYVQIVNFDTLMPIDRFDDSLKAIACIAVWAGKVRLIDNIEF
jgi:pantoate--beta-alanine ligase